MVEQDFKNFYESINKELIAVKDRVRSLIGEAHWGEDGRYKEAVLKNVISRFLPKNLSIGTGFVINPKKELTNQIDLIIYDDRSPVLFSEGDFVIVPANIVRAIIEVKTSIRNGSDLKETIKKCEQNGKKIETVAQNDKIFNGLFCYECFLTINTIRDSLKDYFNITDCSIFKKVSNIALGDEKFLHVWWEHKPFSLKGYEIPNLSFAYFIANLLAHLDSRAYINQSLFFPLKTKAPFEKFEIPCEEEWKGYI